MARRINCNGQKWHGGALGGTWSIVRVEIRLKGDCWGVIITITIIIIASVIIVIIIIMNLEQRTVE